MVVPGLKIWAWQASGRRGRSVAARGEIWAWQAVGTLARVPLPEVITTRAVMVRRRWLTRADLVFWGVPLKAFSLTVYLRGRREMR